ncbi:MAG: DNA/RNA non-specific endonuclease [Bacteroidales bacterium]|nr:DNA/RNA non-specific endonuclease [Bacteroidales bacterium]
MKYIFHKTIIGIILLGLLTVTSCREEKSVSLDIGFSLENTLVEAIVVGAERSSSFLWIKTEDGNAWTATSDDDWLSVSPASGTGELAIVVGYTENTTGQNRTGTVTVSVGSISQSVQLTQRIRGSVVGNPDGYVPFRLELPLVRDSSWFIQHDIGGMANFALEFDTGQRHAVWVAYQLTRGHLAGSIDRDFFFFDPRIPIDFQAHEVRSGIQTIPRFWTLYGYERGHLMASADRTFNQTANDQSNFMSNISPHLPEFHNTHGGTGSGQGIWLRLEHLTRDWARQQGVDTLYVVKGGSIIPDAPGTEIVEVLYRINRTVVPRFYFKAIVQRRGDTFEGIAFWLEQYRGMARRAPTQADAMTIRELEHLTGIDFFPNLSVLGAEIGRPNLEDSVETSPINWSRWPGIN